ncbi:DUF3047 domain-containing protein [Sphingopyxis sp. EG6]|jgi:hypothetical protein|uniref:DUF3047 domain-containing protein n=1 Tax=Sphingopyxis sp. EG6 TaxID=1874061 RepID=UPI000DC628CF|nr:DUF3047 domain-containing protein [Sphingopyxis sp. EG6]MEA3264732.1 DUF3047 domain-containing protein [Pseudomonadota bacterium]BBB08529.1 hypothetical protein SPYCW_1545 [Sphingopyxis sp. EG6]
MIATALLLAAAQGWVGRFTTPGPPPAPWRVVRIGKKAPPTRFRVTKLGGVTAMEAVAVKSMALLARPVTVDLAATPVLCWRWWIDAPVAAADMRSKRGDDYAARIYVAFDLPDSAMSRGTRFKLGIARRLFGSDVPDAALNYVWDNRHPVGTTLPSAYTDRARLIVAETGSTQAGRWVSERADVAADFGRAFGGVPGKLTQIAIASDTDNTGSSARAGFADLQFVGRDQRCPA